MSCSELSLAAGEQLAGTATTAGRWLLVESRGAWGRDAVADSGLPLDVCKVLEAFDGRVLLIRRPDRRHGITVVHAEATEAGGQARRLELESLEELPGIDVAGGVPLDQPVVLVCVHGRRDACCVRLGVPLYDALDAHLPTGTLWQVSHLGGHRFAPNVLVLPFGVQLGRVPAGEAPAVAASLGAGRIPLDRYRGRTIYPAPVQAAEVALRQTLGLDRIGDLYLLSHAADAVRFAVGVDEVTMHVEEVSGPTVPASCGAEPEPMRTWSARIESGPGRASAAMAQPL